MNPAAIMGTAAAASGGSVLLGSLLKGLMSQRKTKTFSVNGNEILKTKVRGGKTSTNMNLSDDEQSLLNYTNKNLLSGLENINVFSDDVQKSIQNQVNAYTNQGIKTINKTYTPILRNLRNDIASRFGNLDNSVFMDNLNTIESNRAEAIEDLTQNILAKQAELYEQEMNYRYNYLNQLSNTNKNINSNILNFLQMAASNT